MASTLLKVERVEKGALLRKDKFKQKQADNVALKPKPFMAARPAKCGPNAA